MKSEINKILFVAISAFVLLVVIGFTGVKNNGKRVNDVVVEIEDQNGNYFTDRRDVINLINAGNTDYVLGLSMDELDLKVLEERVEANPLIKDAQVYHDVMGNLIVTVRQAQPVARIINRKGPDQYIDMDGELLPTSRRYTARVPIVDFKRGFSWEKNITESEYGTQLLELLNFINEDEFWRAQIAGMEVAKDGEVTLLPQVTKQEVKFGMPDDVERKFSKLMVFYKKILPNKGWNTYSSVNVKFENQIVCE